MVKKVQIAAVQFYLRPIKTFSDFEAQVMKAIDQSRGSDFVVFPEYFTLELLSTYPNPRNLTYKDVQRVTEFTWQYIELFSTISRRTGQYIVAGSHLEKEGKHYYNTCYLFGPDGTMFKHKKTHVFPFERKWNAHEGNSLEVIQLDKATVGISICYEAEIPECVRILTLKGAEIIFSPSFGLTEAGFWRVRYSCQANCVENQIYVVNSALIGDIGILNFKGWGKSSILSPCDAPWPQNGIIAEGKMNKEMVVKGIVDIDELHRNRERGAATTFRDRERRKEIYRFLNYQ
jgi:predicted amidohydrolase